MNLKQSIFEIFSLLTEKSIIFSHQNAPRPKGDYMLINITNISSKSGFPSIQKNDDNTYKKSEIMTLSISNSIFGPTSFSESILIHNNLTLPSTSRLFFSKGFGVSELTDVRNLTYVENNNWTSRFQFDMQLMYASNIDYTELFISNMEIEYSGTKIGKITSNLET